ncbi:uncharacterized protein [Lolium perenne]|uniref:uncharacterized protein n=1 Tax=Lolium perenne TaxID=4522 RepID=UPI0021EAD473|nr:uncharacterized protein LOC127337161 [Lolium perenne]
MSGSYSSRLRGGGAGGSLGATTLLAAKVAFASAALAAAASLARVAIPQLVSGADAFLWKLYLFVTVHVIIFVIWKLSDNKHFHASAHKDPWAPVPHHPAPPLLSEDVARSAMKRKVEFAPADSVVRGGEEYRVPQLVSRLHEAVSPAEEGVVSQGSCFGEPCVTTTTESDEDESYAAVTSSAYVAAADTMQGVAPARERVFVERGLSLPPPPEMVATAEYFDDADHDHASGDDDLDATWNAIMQKTRPATVPALSSSSKASRSSPPRPRAREPSVGAVELSRRSDDFIKKIHHSFGRQQ